MAILAINFSARRLPRHHALLCRNEKRRGISSSTRKLVAEFTDTDAVMRLSLGNDLQR